VAGAGDVSGDGRSDVIAGAPNAGAHGEGSFVVFPEPSLALSLGSGVALLAALARRRGSRPTSPS
jgi:hypothetical protein